MGIGLSHCVSWERIRGCEDGNILVRYGLQCAARGFARDAPVAIRGAVTSLMDGGDRGGHFRAGDINCPGDMGGQTQAREG